MTWVDERIDLSGVRHFIAEKGVPVHTQKIWYYLGGMTLFLFGVQIFTGILLLLYYRPSASEAYESVQFKDDTSQLWCACHNGMYDLGGAVVSGPPPRGLEQFVVNLRGEGDDAEIVVSRS